jgi:hypothetical protein
MNRVDFHRHIEQKEAAMIERTKKPSAPEASGSKSLTAGAFRSLLEDLIHDPVHLDEDEQRKAAERRFAEVRAMIEQHPSDELWRDRLHRASEAARAGHHESLVFRLPSGQCTDGGLAINVQAGNWPQTLSGEAADAYRIWEQQLKPQGFLLTARILEYPHGNFGDVGLFLSWAGDE